MATLFMTAALPISVEQAWRRVAAVDQVHDILPIVTSCSLEGDQRACLLANGAQLKEKIISIDDELKRLAYCVVDSPFGLEYHAASMQITSDGEGSRINWTTDFKPDQLKEVLTPMLEQMFAQLSERLSAA